MKRIEFIAPVKSMRGNFGSRQSLVYAPDDNRAFDSIPGQLNPALNYEPRLIGARGKRNYFCVKTKSSVRLTAPSMNAMAILGGVGAIYSALVRDKMALVYVNAYACYQDAIASGFEGTFRKYMYGYIKTALDNYNAHIVINTENHNFTCSNPWDKLVFPPAVSIPLDVTIKFWNIFSRNGVVFTIEGSVKGIGWSDISWADFIRNFTSRNILRLTTIVRPISGQPVRVVMYGNQYLLDSNGDYVHADAYPIDGMNYGLGS